MKIWILRSDVENYAWLKRKCKISLKEDQTYDGRSKKENWLPFEVEKMEDDAGDNKEFSDFPRLSSHTPVFEKIAVETLKDLLIENTEILPLINSEREFFLINVTKVLDCVNYEKSEYKTFDDGKRIMRFIKYVFDISKIKNEHIFKIIDERIGAPFVSDEFRNRVISSGLIGFRFELAWDSEKD